MKNSRPRTKKFGIVFKASLLVIAISAFCLSSLYANNLMAPDAIDLARKIERDQQFVQLIKYSQLSLKEINEL